MIRPFERSQHAVDRALRRRLTAVAALLLCGFAAAASRITWLQTVHADEALRRTLDLAYAEYDVWPLRGEIRDRHGRELVRTVVERALVVVPAKLCVERRAAGSTMGATECAKDAAAVATLTRLMAPFAVGVSVDELVRSDERSEVVVNPALDVSPGGPWMTSELRERIRRLGGVFTRNVPSRATRFGAKVPHVLGRVEANGDQLIGKGGLEQHFDAVLAGQPYKELRRRNGAGDAVPLPQNERIGIRRGPTLTTTLSFAAVNAAQTVVDDTLAKYFARRVVLLAMQPRTGAVLAVAQAVAAGADASLKTEKGLELPDNTVQGSNSAVHWVPEPGSTFKAVVFSLWAEQIVPISADKMWNTRNGVMVLPGPRTIRDAHGYASLSTHDCFTKSSNICSYELAKALGRRPFLERMAALGFGRPTGIELPDELAGGFPPLVAHYDKRTGAFRTFPEAYENVKKVSEATFANNAFGHGLNATPLQVVSAFAAIAADGVRPVPTLVRRIVDHDDMGNTDITPPPRAGERVMSSAAAARMRDLLTDAAGPQGTGSRAKPVRAGAAVVAGKTGTAKKLKAIVQADKSVRREYTSDYVSSFVGWLGPQTAGLVVGIWVDEPGWAAPPELPEGESLAVQDRRMGGAVAAPAFAAFAEKLIDNGVLAADGTLLDGDAP